jgi:hypothetical protein
MKKVCKRGDVILYKKPPTFLTSAEEFGEELEDGFGHPMYYHVAIALTDTRKIEANGMYVATAPIDYGPHIDCFRPPTPPADIERALQRVLICKGQGYDWWLIADDAIRYMSFQHFHLPIKFIECQELHHKVCSSLVEIYIPPAFRTKDLGENASPEDDFLQIAKYKVW